MFWIWDEATSTPTGRTVVVLAVLGLIYLAAQYLVRRGDHER